MAPRERGEGAGGRVLIIERQVNEGFLIGDNVRVVVCRVQDGKVRIGIQAPLDVVVLRDEVAARMGVNAVPRVQCGSGKP